MFFVFFDTFLLPIAPSEINLSVGSKNETIELINGNNFTFVKDRGLREFSFDFMIPHTKYTFASYWLPSSVILAKLEELKKVPFQFIVTRMNLLAVDRFTNVTVTLEEYSIKESADNGLDLIVTVKLKECQKWK